MRGLEGRDCRYLYSLCCYELNLLAEGESVMLQEFENAGQASIHDIVDRLSKSIEMIPHGAHGLHLLGITPT